MTTTATVTASTAATPNKGIVDLVHGVAKKIVNGSNAGKVELRGRNCAGKNLESDSEQAAGVGQVPVVVARSRDRVKFVVVVSGGGGWGEGSNDETQGKERDGGRVVGVHG